MNVHRDDSESASHWAEISAQKLLASGLTKIRKRAHRLRVNDMYFPARYGSLLATRGYRNYVRTDGARAILNGSEYGSATVLRLLIRCLAADYSAAAIGRLRPRSRYRGEIAAARTKRLRGVFDMVSDCGARCRREIIGSIATARAARSN